jgi:PAS domain S-box-containing protein
LSSNPCKRACGILSFNRGMAKQHKRPTIGFLTHSISDGYGRSLLEALLHAAKRYDTNLICYVGNDYKIKRGYEAQGNIVYNFIDEKQIDGVIFSGGAISNYISAREFADFCHSFGGMAKASIAAVADGVPSVVIDNHGGVIQAMDHLVMVHGHRRILAVKGPKANSEARIRFKAYREALSRHNLEYDPGLVSGDGDFQRTYATRFLTQHLEKYGVNFDAIITFSDPDAEGCMSVLIEKGINIPGDVALVGFNDMDKVVTYLPSPLTTVHQPVYEQAYKAFELVIDQLSGKKVPEMVNVKTSLAIRQSCGCHSQTALESEVETFIIVHQDTRLTIPKAKLMNEILDASLEADADVDRKYFAKVFDAFHNDLGGNNYEFITAIEAAVQILPMPNPISFWHNFISHFRRCYLHYITDHELERRAENLWQQARIVISEMLNRSQLYELERSLTSETRMIRQLGEQMITSIEMDEMMSTLVSTLPGMGIDSCYISLYDDEAVPPQWSRLIFGFKENKQIKLEDQNGVRFKTSRLVPPGFLPENRRYSMALLPLYIKEEQIGLVFFEASLRSALIYESLQSQLSSALRSATLVKQINKLSHAVKYSASSIFITDGHGNIEYVNPTFQEQTGYTAHEVFGKHMSILFAEENPPGLLEKIKRTVSAGEIWTGDLLNRKKDDGTYWVLTSISPVHHFNKIINYAVIQEDITEHRDLEKKLQDSLEKINRELETARSVQRAVLPQNLDEIYGENIHAFLKTSGSIGGDIYDVKRVGHSRYAFMVADVSGHGIPAALFSFVAKNSFSRNSNPLNTAGEILSAMNVDITRDITGGNFITAFLGILDREKMCFEFSSAGHPPALMYRRASGTVERLTNRNPFMGITGRHKYTFETRKVESGDRVLMYSDGLIEALDDHGRMYDITRVETMLLKSADKPVIRAAGGLIDDLNDFISGNEQKDDLTFLLFEIP